ncbi:LOW QUALITY PROTEIN: hypothetical protein BC938DRAFT_483770 [Jimgerdemannia flammicorona]|uniref:Uncharacterized protein n=1 Tax=Jimgerdemannia flammicorona TaxID=994334 RepID=A0A433QB96_9FUNG|nr:LOW QUALITY PROTEIN: hypothetical protein BC938DRAFT_483770 [Jimgerdemannia flammicorona]
MSGRQVHKYFERKPSEWNVLGFLEECDREPFQTMITRYLTSLEIISQTERGRKQERAKQLWLRTLLIPRTIHGDRSDRKKAQKWEEEREKPKAVGGSVHLHKPMFMGNPLIGTGAINGGEFSARLSEGIISKARGVQDTAKLVSPYL